MATKCTTHPQMRGRGLLFVRALATRSCIQVLSEEEGSQLQFISPQSRTWSPESSLAFESRGRKVRLGMAYLTMLHSGSIRTMVGSSMYWKTRSWWILALSTCTVTSIASTSSEDVVLQTM